MTREQRYWTYVDVREPNDCWPWLAHRDTKGFGKVADGMGHSMPAHRYGYELAHGPIKPGDVIDHTCHGNDATCPGGKCEHRACQNPAHLEAVSPAENTRRGRSFSSANAAKTHCPYGHELNEQNTYGPDTYQGRKGVRACKLCAQRRARKQRAAERY